MITSKKKPILWLLSDTHLIADSLHDDGLAFQHMRNTSAGKDLDYQEIALTAFVRKVIQEKPTAVIITGDVTFNGAKISGERLANIFKPLSLKVIMKITPRKLAQLFGKRSLLILIIMLYMKILIHWLIALI